MGTTLNRHAYQRMIDENLEWLLKQPRSLERDHIETIVRQSPDREYGPARPTPSPAEVCHGEKVHPLDAAECEKCNKARECFHYCAEHHKTICMGGLPPAAEQKPPTCDECLHDQGVDGEGACNVPKCGHFCEPAAPAPAPQRCTCDHFEHKDTGECTTCGMFCGPISNEVGQEMLKAWNGDDWCDDCHGYTHRSDCPSAPAPASQPASPPERIWLRRGMSQPAVLSEIEIETIGVGDAIEYARVHASRPAQPKCTCLAIGNKVATGYEHHHQTCPIYLAGPPHDWARLAEKAAEKIDEYYDNLVGFNIRVTGAKEVATIITESLQGVAAPEEWLEIESAPVDTLIRIMEQATNWIGTGIRKVYTDADNHTESYCQVLHYNGDVLVPAFYATHWQPLSATSPVAAKELYDQKEATKCIKCGHWLEFYNCDTWKCEFQLPVAATDAQWNGQSKDCGCVCEHPAGPAQEQARLVAEKVVRNITLGGVDWLQRDTSHGAIDTIAAIILETFQGSEFK